MDMTEDEREILRLAGQIYIQTAVVQRKYTSPEDRTILRYRAADEAVALYRHIIDLDIHKEPAVQEMQDMRTAEMQSRVAELYAIFAKHEGNVANAAQEIGVSPKTLYRRLKAVDPEYRTRWPKGFSQLKVKVAGISR